MRKPSLSAYNEINGARWMTETAGQPKSTKETRKILSREGSTTHGEKDREKPHKKTSPVICLQDKWKIWSCFANKELRTQELNEVQTREPCWQWTFFWSSQVLLLPSRKAVSSKSAKKFKKKSFKILQDLRFMEIISNPCSVKEPTSQLSYIPISKQKLLQSNAFICFGFLNLFEAPHFPGTSAVIYDTVANTLHL